MSSLANIQQEDLNERDAAERAARAQALQQEEREAAEQSESDAEA